MPRESVARFCGDGIRYENRSKHEEHLHFLLPWGEEYM